MKGDFTRLTFKKEKHYSSVRMQQGRVQVDADWNEQADITMRRIETEAADLIGGCGGPLHYPGFHLVANVSALNPEEQTLEGNQNPPTLEQGDLYLSAGRYYVDGVQAENERIVTLSEQPYLPDLETTGGVLSFGSLLTKAIGPGKIDFDLPGKDNAAVYQAYLDVWQRHLTALEDPSIREKALGGPDTATRTQTVWQVKLLKANEVDDTTTTCLSPLNLPKSTGRLKAQTKEVATPPDPCVVPKSAGYRGLENQLYRVEIHHGGDASTATFKWSRENGSVMTRWTGQDTLKPNVLTVESSGRDAVLGFSTGDWVELTDDLRELWGLPGTMVQVETVEGTTLTVKKDPPAISTPLLADFQGNPKIRRWDHHKGSQPKPAEAVLPVEEGKCIDLEQGVQVWFEPNKSNEPKRFYRTGDYWLIPARTANVDTQSGQIEWPFTEPQLPHGIQHHCCPLAVLTWDGTAFTTITDCRCVFSPMTHLTGFFYVGGDGQEAMPGDPVPQLLQVGVFNVGVSSICTPVTGAKVRFTAQPPNGRVAATHPNLPSAGNSIDVVTGPDGIASCAWQLAADRNDPATWTPTTQQVEARLLDAIDTALPQVVRFTGNLSIASQVAYDPGECITLQGQETVQQAIDRLSQLVSLYYVSGDGQEVMPGETLQPLKVLAANRCGPVQGMTVTWTVESGGGSVNPVNSTTDVNGLAMCNWTLGPSQPTQVVVATLQGGADQIVPPITVRFTANLSIASQVAYTPPDCPTIPGPEIPTVQVLLKTKFPGWPTLDSLGNTTVKEILDPLLCKLDAGKIPYDPTIRRDRWEDIKEGLLGTPPAPNTVQDALDELLQNLESSDISYRVPGCGSASDPTVRSLLTLSPNEDITLKEILNKLLCDLYAAHLPIRKSDPLCNELKKDHVKTVQDALNVLCELRSQTAVSSGLVTFKDVKAGEARQSPPITHGLDTNYVAIVMGLEFTMVLLGDLSNWSPQAPITIAAYTPGDPQKRFFIFLRDRRTSGDATTWRVRWWAIPKTMDREGVVVPLLAPGEPRFSREFLLTQLMMNPGMTVGNLASDLGVELSAIQPELDRLRAEGRIRIDGGRLFPQ